MKATASQDWAEADVTLFNMKGQRKSQLFPFSSQSILPKFLTNSMTYNAGLIYQVENNSI